MVLKNCLKISYKGLTRNIVCQATLCYEDIITKIMEAFDFMDTYRNAIQIYDEHGSKFDKEVFEYFVLLFPNPQKLFFIRLDASKCWINNSSAQDLEKRKAFTVSQSANIMKNDDSNTLNATSEAVPVRRQNCFLGQWPSGSNTNSEQSLQTSLYRSSEHQRDIVLGIVKNIKQMQYHNDHHKTKHLSSSTSAAKRSMRF